MAEDKASTQGPGALAGLKVIDLTRVLGGPYCTMVLSDHGAEVIKLEPPQGDETREWGPPFDDGGAGRKLQAGQHGKMGSRLRGRAVEALPPPDTLPCFRFRG